MPLIGGYFRNKLNNIVLYYFKVIQNFYLTLKSVEELWRELGNNSQYIKEGFEESFWNMKSLENQIHGFSDVFPELITNLKDKIASIIVINT